MTSRSPLTQISHCSLTNSISFMSANNASLAPARPARSFPEQGLTRRGCLSREVGPGLPAPSHPGPSQGGGRSPRKPAQHSSRTEAARRGLGRTDRLETEGG